MALFGLIRKARYDQAIDQFFTPYAAVKSPKTAAKLFSERGNFTIDTVPSVTLTAKEEAAALAKAKRKMARIIAARKKAAETAVFEEK